MISSDAEYTILKRCIHDIRNFKELTNKMIESIRDMSESDKMEIIIAYNHSISVLQELIVSL